MKRRSLGKRRPGEAAQSRRGVFAALLVATALIAASCGGSSSETATDTGASAEGSTDTNTESGSEAEPAAGSFPDTEVLSLNDGTNVKFDELVSGGDTPVLLWFYFPH